MYKANEWFTNPIVYENNPIKPTLNATDYLTLEFGKKEVPHDLINISKIGEPIMMQILRYLT